MPRIAGLPDLSKFVRRVDKTEINNTMHLVIGVVSIEVNGYIISLKSDILEDLVTTQREIYLDQFVGEEDGIQDCVELLYGGEIKFNNINIKTIMKFSVVYKVHDMYKLCLDWIKGHMSAVTLCNMIELGLLIEIVGQDNHVILDLCKTFIVENVQDDLFKLSQSWSLANNINFIRFLVQDEILYFTLPILTSWISNDSSIRLILEQLELKGLTQVLPKLGSRTIKLIEKMSDKMELVETSRKILKLQISTSKEMSACSSKDVTISNKDLTYLLSENYQSFSVEKLLGLVEPEEYGLEHFEFVDIALNWIMSNTPSQDDITRLWHYVRQHELSYYYLCCVRKTILSSARVSDYTTEAPEIDELDYTEYQFLYDGWDIDDLSAQQRHSLLNNKNVVLIKSCEKCCTDFNITLRLENKHPCYVLDEDSHCLVKHWYIALIGDCGKCYYYSLITNNYSDVIKKIKECLDTGTWIFLCCLYKCRCKTIKKRGKERRK